MILRAGTARFRELVCIETAFRRDIEVQCRELATPSRELHDMAKKRKAARKRVTRKPARRRRASPDATINTLVILVVIVMVLGGLFLYAQNKKQAALWPGLMQAIAALPAPAPTALPATLGPAAMLQAIQPAAGVEALRPAAVVAPIEPAAVAVVQTPR